MKLSTSAGLYLEIVPRGGEMNFYEKVNCFLTLRMLLGILRYKFDFVVN